MRWKRLSITANSAVRHIGVSNFSIAKLRALMSDCRIQPAVNQVEVHPYFQQQPLVDWCQAHGIQMTAYAPLGSSDRPEHLSDQSLPRVLDDPIIRMLTHEKSASPAKIILSWAFHRGISAVPKSVHAHRIVENLSAVDVLLNEADMQQLAKLDRRQRYLAGDFWVDRGAVPSMAVLWDE